MSPRAVLVVVRNLCHDIDAARPLRYGPQRIVLPVALPAALGLGISACGDESNHESSVD